MNEYYHWKEITCKWQYIDGDEPSHKWFIEVGSIMEYSHTVYFKEYIIYNN